MPRVLSDTELREVQCQLGYSICVTFTLYIYDCATSVDREVAFLRTKGRRLSTTLFCLIRYPILVSILLQMIAVVKLYKVEGSPALAYCLAALRMLMDIASRFAVLVVLALRTCALLKQSRLLILVVVTLGVVAGIASILAEGLILVRPLPLSTLGYRSGSRTSSVVLSGLMSVANYTGENIFNPVFILFDVIVIGFMFRSTLSGWRKFAALRGTNGSTITDILVNNGFPYFGTATTAHIAMFITIRKNHGLIMLLSPTSLATINFVSAVAGALVVSRFLVALRAMQFIEGPSGAFVPADLSWEARSQHGLSTIQREFGDPVSYLLDEENEIRN